MQILLFMIGYQKFGFLQVCLVVEFNYAIQTYIGMKQIPIYWIQNLSKKVCYLLKKENGVFLYNNHQNKNIVRFVQITGADEHSFKIRFFSSLLNELKEFFEIHEIEIFFVVLKSKISTFIISPVEDIGALRPWNWQFSKEKEKCQIVGIDGWEKHYLRKLIL